MVTAPGSHAAETPFAPRPGSRVTAVVLCNIARHSVTLAWDFPSPGAGVQVADLARPDYVPTVEDVLKTRVRTSGILGGCSPRAALASLLW